MKCVKPAIQTPEQKKEALLKQIAAVAKRKGLPCALRRKKCAGRR